MGREGTTIRNSAPGSRRRLPTKRSFKSAADYALYYGTPIGIIFPRLSSTILPEYRSRLYYLFAYLVSFSV